MMMTTGSWMSGGSVVEQRQPVTDIQNPGMRALTSKGIESKEFRNDSSTFAFPPPFSISVVALSVGLVSVAVGIGIPVFYETQIDNAAKRENTQPCFPCSGSGAQRCRFCMGTGNVTVELGGDEKEVSRCINCDGVGTLTCTTCQGSGIQPRYLDRREFKDDD
ncbi:protein SPA [Cucumis melo var. makuwa]|uniref:Protein SPA n=1 Tax=Cucumis melo var. makuwa TaxID=1194695 RepID=A0A5A7V8F1_CUCMM|nr:protein SPA [Cucumis melo var. makuwa]TYK31498.1 protein SPA [Cucumis melo var. makuwa]